MSKKIVMVKRLIKLHHSAFRCKDSEQTRKFYENFLGLKLKKAFEIFITKTGRKSKVLHTFYELKDGSCIAFFEEPNRKFSFKKQRDFDLHIAFEVSKKSLNYMYNKGIAKKIETRGIINHGFINSVYFRDPNGYVIELACPVNGYKEESKFSARKILDQWQINKLKI